MDVLAWLGPAISQPAYEVGADVRDAFLAVQPKAAAHFKANTRGRWQADLYGLARASLAAAGVSAMAPIGRGRDSCARMSWHQNASSASSAGNSSVAPACTIHLITALVF